MVEQQYMMMLFLGSALIMFGLVMLMFSIKPKHNGSTGIILLGPIPIVWGGKNKLILLIPLLLALVVVLVLVL